MPEETPTIPLTCRLGLHPWPRWSEPQEAGISHRVFDFEKGRTTEFRRDGKVQIRTCLGCGKFQWRQV